MLACPHRAPGPPVAIPKVPTRRSLRVVAGVAAVMGIVIVLSGPAFVQAPVPGRGDAEAMSRRAAERIRALREESDGLARQERTLLVELRRLELEQRLKSEELAQIEADRAATAAEVKRTARTLAELEQQVQTQLPSLRGRMVELYKLGRASYLRLMLNVGDMQAMGRAYRVVSQLARLDSQRAADHQRTMAELRSAQRTLAQRGEEMGRLEASVRLARVQLDRAVASHNALVRSVDERRDVAAAFLAELQASQDRLQSTLASLGRAEREASAPPLSLPITPFKGALEWPVVGRILTSFEQPTTRGGAAVVRRGVEIVAPEGTPVLAVHEGRVAYADRFAGFGNMVILEHGHETYSVYGYLDTIEVARGAHARAQTRLGASGRAPAGPTAVYFELRVDGQAVDPIQWCKR